MRDPTPSAFTIRVLGPGDAAVMERMNAMFGEAFGEPATYGDARPSSAYLERLLGGECFVAIAALDGDDVIGGLAVYELRKFEQERSEIFVYDLAVAGPYRRRGIATALLEEAVHVGRQRGAWVVFLQADLGDEPAIALYSKLGRREDAIQFDIPTAE